MQDDSKNGFERDDLGVYDYRSKVAPISDTPLLPVSNMINSNIDVDASEMEELFVPKSLLEKQKKRKRDGKKVGKVEKDKNANIVEKSEGKNSSSRKGDNSDSILDLSSDSDLSDSMEQQRVGKRDRTSRKCKKVTSIMGPSCNSEKKGHNMQEELAQASPELVEVLKLLRESEKDIVAFEKTEEDLQREKKREKEESKRLATENMLSTPHSQGPSQPPTSQESNASTQHPSIVLEVRTQANDKRIKFKVFKHLTFERLHQHLCNHYNVSYDKLKLVFEGEVITDTDTPASFDMENEDLVDVVLV